MRCSRGLVFLLLALLIFVLFQPGTERASADGAFVTRDGTQLLLAGNPFTFTGLNIYNANSSGLCGYAMNSGSALDDALSAIGPGKAAMRAWFFQTLATSGGSRDWSAFDHTLAVARAHGVKVIATLANQWEDCEPLAGYKTATWYQTGYQDPDPGGTVSYRDWVAEIATRYRDDTTILAWQLMNEAEIKDTAGGGCATNDGDILRSWAADVSGLIMSIDPNHLVSLGTIGGGQCGASGTAQYQYVHNLSTIDLCEYHDYEWPDPPTPMPGDQWNGLQTRIDDCTALNKPLFVGEAGIRVTDVPGGTLADRAAAYDAKLQAQTAAGVVGFLAWNWSNGVKLDNNFDIWPDDPVLDVFARLDLDSDGDGCPDVSEQQTDPGTEISGGRRDLKNPNDYFNPTGDGVNRVDDVLMVVQQYYEDEFLPSPPNPPGMPNPDYNPDTDRTGLGPDPWDLGPPDGLQRVDDILAIVNQYFHDCG